MRRRSYFDEPRSVCEGIGKYVIAGLIVVSSIIINHLKMRDSVEERGHAIEIRAVEYERPDINEKDIKNKNLEGLSGEPYILGPEKKGDRERKN